MKSVAQRRSIGFSLADVATKLLAHPDESTVDVAGSLSHPSRSRQCNKRDNQEVLDHSLATLVVVKSLQPTKHSWQLFNSSHEELGRTDGYVTWLCRSTQPNVLEERRSGDVQFFRLLTLREDL